MHVTPLSLLRRLCRWGVAWTLGLAAPAVCAMGGALTHLEALGQRFAAALEQALAAPSLWDNAIAALAVAHEEMVQIHAALAFLRPVERNENGVADQPVAGEQGDPVREPGERRRRRRNGSDRHANGKPDKPALDSRTPGVRRSNGFCIGRVH